MQRQMSLVDCSCFARISRLKEMKSAGGESYIVALLGLP